MVVYIGIDDAGRGPVIGPMILAGVLINPSQEKILLELGVKDSKELSPPKRKKIGDELKKSFQFRIQKATPQEIDSCENLNHLEAQKMARIINELASLTEEKIEAYIDCPSINTSSWKNYLEAFIIDKSKVRIIAEHKADVKYPAVSAASIIAKEEREKEVESLKREFKIDFGSGYPADPKTKEFLENNIENPDIDKIIRHSWETVKKLKSKTKQKSLF